MWAFSLCLQKLITLNSHKNSWTTTLIMFILKPVLNWPIKSNSRAGVIRCYLYKIQTSKYFGTLRWNRNEKWVDIIHKRTIYQKPNFMKKNLKLWILKKGLYVKFISGWWRMRAEIAYPIDLSWKSYLNSLRYNSEGQQ